MNLTVEAKLPTLNGDFLTVYTIEGTWHDPPNDPSEVMNRLCYLFTIRYGCERISILTESQNGSIKFRIEDREKQRP